MASTEGHIFVDFETRSRRDVSAGSFAYAADPSTEILLCAYAVEDEDPICFDFRKDHATREKFYQYLRDGYIFVAHNFLFEIPIIRYVGVKHGWPKMPLGLRQFRCTMQMSGRAGIPLALEFAGKELNLEGEKLDFGKLLIHRFSVPRSDGEFNSMYDFPEEMARFMEYCAGDTIQSRDIWRQCPPWTDSEIDDIAFDLANNLRGVPVDILSAQVIRERIDQELARYTRELGKITKGVITKVTQVQRIKQWVQQHVNPDIPSCDADHIERILAGEFGTVDNVTRQILETRQHGGKSSTSKYDRYIDCNVAHIIRGMQISFGAHTGRPISKLLNLYNLPKPSVDYESMDQLVDDLVNLPIEQVNEKYGSYIKGASTAIRGMIVPKEGMVLCTADYAAIEARIVFWIAACLTGLQKYHDGVDQYVDMGANIYGIPTPQVGEDERWIGKQVILGAGYGLGAQGFVNSCLRWGKEVPLSLAEEAIATYREEYPEIVEMWNALEDAAILACKTGKVTNFRNLIFFKTARTKSGVVVLYCKLPSGRLLTYPHVKLGTVITPWGARKLAVTYHKVKDRGIYRDSTYGGKLTENICQAIARDIMYYGAQQAAKEGYQILFTVYDEVISMIEEDKADIDGFCKLLSTTPDWAKGLPVLAEGKIQTRYEKL